MIEPKATVLAFSAALLIPQGISAQVASRLEAGALMTGAQSSTVGAQPLSSILRIAPGLRYQLPLFEMSAKGSAWLHGQQWQLADGIVSGTLVSPTIYGVRTELIGNASRAFDERSLGSDQVDVQTRIHVLFKEKGGMWVGAGTARPWRVAVVSSFDVANGGAWAKLGNGTFTTTYTRYSFTKAARRDSLGGSTPCGPGIDDVGALERAALLSPIDPTTCRRQSTVSDLEGMAKWDAFGIEFAGQIGYRFGNFTEVSLDSRRWAMATATMWVAPRVAFVMGGGRQPANPSRGLPARTFGTVGMMLATIPMRSAAPAVDPEGGKRAVKAFEIRPAANGMQKITVRVGSAEKVDIIGDFSNWQPLSLVRRGPDLWDLQLPIDAGRHQINIRVDAGKWYAPPNTPMVKDGYGGEAGVIFVGR